MLNKLIYNIIRNGTIFPIKEKYLKKDINSYNLLKSLSRIKAVLADEGFFNILKEISD